MIDQGKKNILGVLVDAIDYEAATARIITAAQEGKQFAVSALAVHGVMTGVLDPAHRHRLNSLDLVTPDGQPVRWSMRWLHDVHLPDRVYGPTLTLKVCERAAQEGLPVYFYGSKGSVLAKLSSNLRERYPGLRIAGIQNSRFRQLTETEKFEAADTILKSGAAIVFVGLGCPRQEVWAYEYRNLLPMPIVAVGAAFDFHAGTFPQAPDVLQRYGLEWFYRLVNEPGRLWKRYLLNPLFLGLLALQFTRLRRFDPTTTAPPVEELRFG
jgi:N-acetylglucosaminyldiphosphoundecaprenol N-acetyl-beta-D-mannosaminyltransferase